MEITEEIFEHYQQNEVTEVTITNDHHVAISCLSLGATWYEFLIPTKNNEQKNLLMNFNSCAEYYNNGLCCCQSIGRVAGRIQYGQFELNNQKVQLPTNENGNTLHGGPHGFRFLNWQMATTKDADQASVIFTNVIQEKHDGFPGDLKVEIIYTLNNQNEVTITYRAQNGSQATLFNPTCHAYFNLSEQPNLTTHELQLNSSKHLQLDAELIPTGKMLAVADSPYDFRHFKNLAAAIKQNHGFDDAFVIEGPTTARKVVAKLREQNSGRQITIESNTNGLVMYTMSHEQPGVKFKRDQGQEAQASEAVALEAQMLPDAINHSDFGNTILGEDAVKMQQIIFKFTQN